jgi:uncharacterized membrane-anchored protein
MVASHGAFLEAANSAPGYEEIAASYFDGNVLVGSRVGDGAATALTDFRVRADGFSRFLRGAVDSSNANAGFLPGEPIDRVPHQL